MKMKTQYIKTCRMQLKSFRGQFTAINAYIDREWSQNNLISHLKALGKEEQTKPSKEKEIIKIRDKENRN